MYNEKSYEASKKYRAKSIKRVPLDMQIAEYNAMKTYAEACGESVNGFIKRAISEAMERDNAATEAAEGRTETKREDT